MAKAKKKRAPRRECRECGCTARDCRQCIIRTGKRCHWILDDLCSACWEPMIGATPAAGLRRFMDIICPEAEGLSGILLWAAAFSCQRSEAVDPELPPCSATTAILCTPCAAEVLLGTSRERFAENAREHKRFMRSMKHYRRERERQARKPKAPTPRALQGRS